MNTDYPIGAMTTLLNEDCILKGFFPLIPYKESLVEKLKKLGCRRKSDCLRLSDEALHQAGLPDMCMINLFRRFLALYDIDPKKLREIERSGCTSEEAAAFRELYHLPGVRLTCARLYYFAGISTLEDLADTSPDDVINRTAEAIAREQLTLKIPLMKEVKTHIAVAKAFTMVDID